MEKTEDSPNERPADVLEDPEKLRRGMKDADSCTLIGAGVGTAGIISAFAGAVCPFCFVAAPALIGLGVGKRIFLKRRKSAGGKS